MRVSRPLYASTHRQQTLFSVPKRNRSLLTADGQHNHGLVRTLLGHWTEQLTAHAFNAEQHAMDSTCDYCPDLSYQRLGAHRIYIECKTAGLSRQTFIYHGRLMKDYDFVQAGYDLNYVVWSHGLYTKDYTTEAQLRSAYVAAVIGFYVVRFAQIYELTRTMKVEKLNSKYGHNHKKNREHGEKMYGSGYRIPIQRLGLIGEFHECHATESILD